MRSLLILLLLSGPAAAETGPAAGVPEADVLQQAVRLFHAQEVEAAEELLLAAGKEQPENAKAAFYLGRVYLERGRSKAAVEALERATRLDPESSDYQFWLAEALVARIGEVAFFFKLRVAKRMRKAYEKAVELDPENLEARVAVARYHSEAPPAAGGSAERAATELAEIERRDPALAHVTRGLIHERLGRAEAVEGELRAAVEADPGSVLGWRELGLFFQRRERWEEAQRAFAEVLACVPDDSVALFESARSAIAIAERQLRNAEDALLGYLQLEPGPEPTVLSEGEPPRRADAYEKLRRVYERQGRPELTVPPFPWRPRAAQKLNPSDRVPGPAPPRQESSDDSDGLLAPQPAPEPPPLPPPSPPPDKPPPE